MRRRSKAAAEPQSQRPAHPDPHIEIQLQQLDTLRARHRDQVAQARHYREEVQELHRTIRMAFSVDYYDDNLITREHQIKTIQDQIKTLEATIPQLDAQADQTHQQIVALHTELAAAEPNLNYYLSPPSS